MRTDFKHQLEECVILVLLDFHLLEELRALNALQEPTVPGALFAMIVLRALPAQAVMPVACSADSESLLMLAGSADLFVLQVKSTLRFTAFALLALQARTQ